jgi:hypothetical protein
MRSDARVLQAMHARLKVGFTKDQCIYTVGAGMAHRIEQSLNNDAPNTKYHDDPVRAKALKNHRDNIANDAC